MSKQNKRIIILGGDGFCGWPTTLHLSAQGYDVCIIDNLSRRNIDNELGCTSLTPIASIKKRIATWQTVSGKSISFINLDLASEYEKLLQVIIDYKPHAIVHFAEQRAAPYSMISSKTKRYTVNNNLNATHNVLCAISESQQDIHLVHLGTMGVYGYGSVEHTIPEGYLPVFVKDDQEQLKELNILYPPSPGSVYHMTKTQDALMFAFYNKNDKLRITDLHQGIVWGTTTPETDQHPDLINRFDYDGEYGTVLNRFLIQAAVNYPLTVYGSGGQTRAFIHLKNTTECIRIAIENPPEKNEPVKIFNQVTETHKVIDLARLISSLTGAKIDHLDNPRHEQAENNLKVSNQQFLKLGLNPITLQHGLLNEVIQIAEQFKNRIHPDMIPSRARWIKTKPVETISS